MGEEKGYTAEESLRKYFLKSGYYVVRGISYVFEGNVISDLDLWLYSKPSALFRERTNVDVKYKKTPHALERIVWAKGLQTILEYENCIVATTEKKRSVRNYALSCKVNLLDGEFLQKVRQRYSDQNDRLTEEELFAGLREATKRPMRPNYVKLYEDAKANLASSLDYSSCNSWLKDLSVVAKEIVNDEETKEANTRLMYIIASYFLLGLDYIMKDLAFLSDDDQRQDLLDGFQYGSMKRDGTKKLLSNTYNLIENLIDGGSVIVSQLQKKIDKEFKSVRADILQEYFLKQAVSNNLFHNARVFEALGFNREMVSPKSLEVEQKSIIGVLLDFLGIERERII